MEVNLNKFYYKILKKSAQIKFLDDLTNKEKVEIIDGNYIDALTLEEMHKLILLYRNEKKDFIIARVMTMSLEGKEELNRFYYSALDFNKELFQIDNKNQILHQMKIKNPLNNLEICKNIDYFKISKNSFKKAIINYFKENNKKINFLKIENDKKELNEIYKKVIEEIMNNQELINTNNKIIYEAKYCGNENYFFNNNDIRNYFKKNLLKNDIFLYEYLPKENEYIYFEDNFREIENQSIFWYRIFLSIFLIGLFFFIISISIDNIIYKKILPIIFSVSLLLLPTIFYIIYSDTLDNEIIIWNDYENI